MKIVYNRLRKSKFRRLIIVAALLIVAALFLQPSISSAVFRYKRQQHLNQLLQSVQQESELDPQLFWKFRESYAPGFFTINPDVIKLGQTYQIKNIPLQQKVPILEYHSRWMKSTDFLCQKNTSSNTTAQTIIADKIKKLDKVIVKTDRLLIGTDEKQNLIIWFSKSIEDMKLANGFFNYNSQERELLSDYYWCNQTVIYK